VTASFQRYLRAKRTVDDRALDRRLVDAFGERLVERGEDGLRMLEAGAGIGTMLARLWEWELLPAGTINYTAVDVDPGTTAGIEPYLQEWAAGRSVSVSAGSSGAVSGSEEDGIRLDGPDRTVELKVVTAEAVSYAATAGEFDALVGAALLDILGLDGLETLVGSLAPGGVYYFPITFDGATRFRPSHPADRAIERRYHDHMDRKPGGNSRAGGDALDALRRMDGTTVLGVAGSDWIVRPVDGEYPGDEAYFLRWILDSVSEAVGEVADDDFGALDGWVSTRREQLADGELVYHTHQLDMLGRVDP